LIEQNKNTPYKSVYCPIQLLNFYNYINGN
jgi:hypothetical protein